MRNEYPPAYEATPSDTLREQIMNPCIPKNEREWWAAREIERLTAERDAFQAERGAAAELLSRNIDALRGAVIERDKWQEDARTRAQNTDYWRAKCGHHMAEVERLREVLTLVGDRCCDVAHHPKKYQHDYLADCPIESMIRAALEGKA